MNPRGFVVLYFGLQATSICLWWCILWVEPSLTWLFFPTTFDWSVVAAFTLPDLLLVLCSVMVALQTWKRDSPVEVALCALGLAAYPTLFCIAASWLTGQAWLAAGLMATMLFGTFICCSILRSTAGPPDARTPCFRPVERTPVFAVVHTSMQVVLFWTYFLLLLPMAICEIERLLGVPPIWTPAFVFWLLFSAASLFGLWSGFTMAWLGKGTPLPTETAPEFVTTGPYHYVRNPMALAGALQGIAVGGILGSGTVMVLSVACGLAWHLFVRPFEERDLGQRFGETYRQYRANVPLWIPRVAKRQAKVGAQTNSH